MAEYNGWKNYSTWNCALWINNDEQYYHAAVEFMKAYEGKDPYKDFCVDSGLDEQRTPDLIKWVSTKLDYKALNDMMWEHNPEAHKASIWEDYLEGKQA